MHIRQVYQQAVRLIKKNNTVNYIKHDNNVMPKNIGTGLERFIPKMKPEPQYKRVMREIISTIDSSSLCSNIKMVTNLLIENKCSLKEIYELIKIAPKDFKRHIKYLQVFDSAQGKKRLVTPQELIKLLKSHPDGDAKALNKLFSLPVTLKEVDNLLSNKALVNKLKEETVLGIKAAVSQTSAANRRIPRYIYHLTTKKHYEDMLSSGVLKMSQDVNFNGVFGVDLTNFFKRWCSSDLGAQLMQQVSKFSGNIVILKIPTEKLNTQNLFIRSQNRYFKNPKSLEEAYINAKKNGHDIGTSLLNWLNKYSGEGYARHIEGTTPASLAAKFKQHKEPIEYIYKDVIPIDIVEKIGETTYQRSMFSNDIDVKNIFLSLLKGTPEVKGAELLKER